MSDISTLFGEEKHGIPFSMGRTFQKETLTTNTVTEMRSDGFQISTSKLIFYESGPQMLGFPHGCCWKRVNYQFYETGNRPGEVIIIEFHSLLMRRSDETCSGMIIPKEHSYYFSCLPVENRVEWAWYAYRNDDWRDGTSVKTEIHLPNGPHLKHPVSLWVQRTYEGIKKELEVEAVKGLWARDYAGQ